MIIIINAFKNYNKQIEQFPSFMDFRQGCLYTLILALLTSCGFITYILFNEQLPLIFQLRFVNFIFQHLIGIVVMVKRRLFQDEQNTHDDLLWMIGFSGIIFFTFLSVQLFGVIKGHSQDQLSIYNTSISFILLSYYHLYYQTNIYFGVFCLFSLAMAIVYWINQRRHTHQMQLVLQQLHSQKYENHKSTQNEQRSCSICLGQFEESQKVYKLVCRHIFHKQCLTDWFKQKLSCPMCRDDVAREVRYRQYEQHIEQQS